MLPPEQCDDDCTPPWAKNHSLSPRSISTLTLSIAPFLITFLLVNFAVLHNLFPRVSSLHNSKDGEEHYLPHDAPPSLRQSHAEHGAKTSRRSIVAISFSTTIALAAVLAELLLCEISNSLDPNARSAALGITVPTLLFFLVILIPFLELRSIITGCGWSFGRKDDGKKRRLPWFLQIAGFMIWLLGFWWLGQSVPASYARSTTATTTKGLSEACVERVGIVGIALMATLSGFAAVSASWQTFGVKHRPVTEADVARKQAGLDATNDMLAAKKSRLRALQRKVHESPSEGFVTKMIGSIRGGGDGQEIKGLELEISGLTSMGQSLSASLTLLQNRLAASQRSSSALGKFFYTPTAYAFALYCVYRILATTLTILRRMVASPDSAAFSSSNTDPINQTLSLLAKYVYPQLDQQAWSQQISFLLSGIILLASFNSVLQTFHMLTKLSPSLLYQAQANLALIIAQISATYVISNAILLRSNLPLEMKSVVSDALGSPLEPGFVEHWFENWFLFASIATALGIWLRRVFAGPGDWDDMDDGDIEMGQKRS
ncbi:Abscisic acid G-protein coupled receptor-domain-containing protein [Bisporella sp. PMI_857]|nr:Abscisic acid G-protein coupled receptor-domain-containing protein [Bisporella sp. PMI_857]